MGTEPEEEPTKFIVRTDKVVQQLLGCEVPKLKTNAFQEHQRELQIEQYAKENPQQQKTTEDTIIARDLSNLRSRRIVKVPPCWQRQLED